MEVSLDSMPAYEELIQLHYQLETLNSKKPNNDALSQQLFSLKCKTKKKARKNNW